MKKATICYLSGSLDKESGSFNSEFLALQKKLTERGVTCLTPELRPSDITNPHAVYVRDVFQSIISDVVVIDARNSCGFGVGAETFGALVSEGETIFLCPPNSHYRRPSVNILGHTVEDWVHPFIASMTSSSFIESFDLDIITQLVLDIPNKSTEWTKSMPKYTKAIAKSYVSEYFQTDMYMQAETDRNPRLKELIECFIE